MMRKSRCVLNKLKRRFCTNTYTCLIIVLIILVCLLKIFSIIFSDASFQIARHLDYVNVFQSCAIKNKDLKYVLQWTTSFTQPFVFFKNGQETFIQRNCLHQNCFVTDNRAFFQDIKDYDAILFHGPDIHRSSWILPTKRSQNQIYVFVSAESSDYYPLCNTAYNKFFNWTWTYRIDSDLPFKYIIITDNDSKQVGPRKYMHWIASEHMTPVGENIKAKLALKSKAAAWFVSNCDSMRKREEVARQLKNELKKYNLQLDIYGDCSNLRCPKEKPNECYSMIEKDYFFYLSFENSFSEDYVTEKLLTALQNYAVPIVYGGANYTRFLPPNAYLDVRKLGVQELAKQMKHLIEDKERYLKFFNWHNHYSYLSTKEAFDAAVCGLCTALNNQNRTEHNIYDNFLEWWTEPGKC